MEPHVPLQRDLVLYASAAIPVSPLLFSWLGLCSTHYQKTASTTFGAMEEASLVHWAKGNAGWC